MPKPEASPPKRRVDPVRHALERLADAQLETQAEVRALAEAQRRTEERVGRLEAAVERLAEAQRRTEERVGRLEAAVERLAEAQRRTEEAVARLAQQVGRLSETIGFTLEDLARDLTPDRLARRHGIQVGALDRAFFRLDGQEVEIDLYGVGQRDGQQIAIVGETKSRIYDRDVEALADRARRLASQLPGTPVPVLFGFVIHPSAREAAARLGAIVIASGG
jgi:predicted nuclease with TOPRIM domain